MSSQFPRDDQHSIRVLSCKNHAKPPLRGKIMLARRRTLPSARNSEMAAQGSRFQRFSSRGMAIMMGPR